MISTVDTFRAEEEFYSKPFYLSYSGLNKLLFSPRVFYNQYILRVKEEKMDSHLIEGKLIHTLILEKEKFNEQFIITPGKLPSDTNKFIIDQLFEYVRQTGDFDTPLEEHQEMIIELMVKANHYQALKTDAQRIEKMCTLENDAYFLFLKQQTGKTLIDTETYEKCLSFVEEMTQDKDIAQALQLNPVPSMQIFNEHYLTCPTDIENIHLKGFLDRLILDPDHKMAIIPDVKTTAKPIDKFTDTIEYFRYHNQAAIYARLAKCHIPEDWTVQFKFVVIDGFKQTYVFDVSDNTLNYWDQLLSNDLERFAYHYTQKNYSKPYELLKRRLIL